MNGRVSTVNAIGDLLAGESGVLREQLANLGVLFLPIVDALPRSDRGKVLKGQLRG